jgi:hypothetical protein
MATTPQTPFKTMGTEDITVTNPNNLAAVYSNNFGVSATMTDFTIYFLEVGQMPGDKTVIQKQEVKAVVTLPLMAAVGLQQAMLQVWKQAQDAMKQAQAQAKVKADPGGKQ